MSAIPFERAASARSDQFREKNGFSMLIRGQRNIYAPHRILDDENVELPPETLKAMYFVMTLNETDDRVDFLDGTRQRDMFSDPYSNIPGISIGANVFGYNYQVLGGVAERIKRHVAQQDQIAPENRTGMIVSKHQADMLVYGIAGVLNHYRKNPGKSNERVKRAVMPFLNRDFTSVEQIKIPQPSEPSPARVFV